MKTSFLENDDLRFKGSASFLQNFEDFLKNWPFLRKSVVLIVAY